MHGEHIPLMLHHPVFLPYFSHSPFVVDSFISFTSHMYTHTYMTSWIYTRCRATKETEHGIFVKPA